MTRLLLHLATLEPIVDKDCAHVHTLTAHHLHSTRHLLRNAHTLHLHDISHFLTRARVSELSFHHLLLRRHLLLHLEFDIIEHAIEVDRVQFNWHLDCRILLEVHQRSLALLRINHASSTFNPLALLERDLLAIEDHELDETLADDDPIVGLPGDRVMNQREVEEVWKLGEFLDLEELLNPIVGDVQRLELLELLDVGERAQAVLIQLQDHDLMMRVEAIDIDLTDTILTQI